MEDSDDALHLKAWCRDRCEKSFRFIVHRYLGMVYALAVRRLGSGTHAGDVAQNVFLVLARKAGGLRLDAPLSPWLHRCTMIECADLLRRESRRMDAMKNYFEHAQNDGHPDVDPWREIVPHLDQAVDTLGRSDRDVIVMRFYQRLNYGEIGAALGKTAGAAQKQGERALERICHFLRQRGIVTSVAVLVPGLAANVKAAAVAETALAPLVTQITRNAVAGTAVSLTLIQTLLHTLMNSKSRTALITAAVAAIPLAWKWQQNTSLTRELAALREKVQPGSPASGTRLSGNGNAARSVASNAARENADTPQEAGSAWEQALLEGDPIERHRKISDLIAKLTSESAPRVLAAFDRLKEKGLAFDAEKMLFLRAWGRLDGAAAMAALKGDSALPPGDSFACAALAGWAAKDAAAAKAYIEAIADPQRKSELTYGLLDGWAAVDFEAAAAYAANSPRSSERDRFRELLLARAFSTGGIEGAQKFFAGIPADEHNQLYRQRAFEDVTKLLMTRDPAMARDWLAKQENQSLINAGVLAMAGTNDASGTLGWMESLTGLDPKVASKVASDILSRWAQADPVAATAWMNSQSNRADRDSLVSSMARAVGYTETEGAVKWAQTINDPEQRQQTMDSIIRRSLRRDPAGAPAELAALGISQEEMEQAQSRGGPVSSISKRNPDGSETSFSVTGMSGGTISLDTEPAPVGATRQVFQYENGSGVKETVVFAPPGATPASVATGGASLSIGASGGPALSFGASGGLSGRLVDNGVE